MSPTSYQTAPPRDVVVPATLLQAQPYNKIGFVYPAFRQFRHFAGKTIITTNCWFVNGGGRGIRTPATLARPVGFQDRSLQPDLGIPPVAMVDPAGFEPATVRL